MMTHKETISALLDNELAAADQERLARSLNEPTNQGFYLRQSTVKELLHGDHYTALPADFMSQVAAKIDREVTIFAPGNIQQKQKDWRQRAIGLAVAASVAMVSLGVFQYARVSQAPEGTMPLAQTRSPAASSANVLPAFSSLSGSSAAGYQRADDEYIQGQNNWSGADLNNNIAYQRLLNQYLATHTEISSVGQIQGIMPYSKIVGNHTVTK